MDKFSVGTVVKVKDFYTLVGEFGYNRDGDLSTDCCFVRCMREYCGDVIRVTEYNMRWSGVDIGYNGWNISADCCDVICDNHVGCDNKCNICEKNVRIDSNVCSVQNKQ